MKVYFATNRDPNRQNDPDDFGGDFNPRRHQFRVGHASVEPTSDQPPTTEADLRVARVHTMPETQPSPEDRRQGNMRFPRKGSSALLSDILEDPRDGDVFVFIHGAAYTFQDALKTTALCADFYSQEGSQVIPFVFSYPTNGYSTPLNYFADVCDADASGVGMARAYAQFLALVKELQIQQRKQGRAGAGCGRRIHLVVHSLGNRALQAAVQAIVKIPVFHVARLFHSVFLCNADVDADALDNADQLQALPRFAHKLVIHFDFDDKLVDLSDTVHANRLGQAGPPRLPDPPEVDGCQISVLNLTGTTFDIAEDRQRHRHYKGSQVVIDDMKSVMAGQPPANRTPVPEKPGFFVVSEP